MYTMLSLEIEEFMIQLKEGTINNVGGPRKAGTVKLFDVAEAEARAFGDNRVKLAFADEDDNTVEVALSPAAVKTLLEDIAQLRADGDVTGLEE